MKGGKERRKEKKEKWREEMAGDGEARRRLGDSQVPVVKSGGGRGGCHGASVVEGEDFGG